MGLKWKSFFMLKVIRAIDRCHGSWFAANCIGVLVSVISNAKALHPFVRKGHAAWGKKKVHRNIPYLHIIHIANNALFNIISPKGNIHFQYMRISSFLSYFDAGNKKNMNDNTNNHYYAISLVATNQQMELNGTGWVTNWGREKTVIYSNALHT